jgi:hypothetical protein
MAQHDEDMNFGMTDPEMQQRYGGQIVAIWQKQVWGAGGTYAEALRAALDKAADASLPNKPTKGDFALLPIPKALPADFVFPDY